MKFRARMVETMALRKFYNVLQSMTKLTKTCVLRLAMDKVYFISTEPLGGACNLPMGGPSIWCEMQQEYFFNEYKLEGVTPDQPEIYLEFEPDKLLKAMSLVKSMKGLKIKLSKINGQPCLSFDIDLTPTTINDATTTTPFGRQCVHDVPVTVLPRKVWSNYGEPVMKDPDISICLPELKRLKHLAERYKNLDHYAVLQAYPDGRLLLKLESDLASVTTHFRQLEVVAKADRNDNDIGNLDGDGDDNDDDATCVRVDLRLLSLYLGADHISPKRVLANLVRDKMLYLLLMHDAVFMEFCLPAVLA